MAIARLSIPTLSGGVGRQAPSKRLVSEAEDIDNCLITVEKSIEKRPPLVHVRSGENSTYLDVPMVTPVTTFDNGGAADFNTDNLYFHWLDIDGFNRYCIIINRAGYTFNPTKDTLNSFTYNGHSINASDFITVYRVEPTQWVKEVVDTTLGTIALGGFNRGIFEYLTYGNKAGTSDYKLAGTVASNIPASSIDNTFGSMDFDVGFLLWNKLIPLDFLPDRSNVENAFTPALWDDSFVNNQYIHAGDTVNYKTTVPASATAPGTENSIDIMGVYWENVRDNIVSYVDGNTLEVTETGQNRESFLEVPQYPATRVRDDTRDLNGYQAWRMLNAYYDNPKVIPIPGGVIDWSLDHYYKTSPLEPEQRDDSAQYNGLGKVYFTRNPFLTFPVGFYRATRYSKNPYFERIRTEGEKSVLDHRRFPLVIYKDTAGDGVWKIKEMPLFPRRTGNPTNNPGPSSLKRKEKVQAMSIWKNRLWVATDNNIFSSRVNSFYNFWVDDITNITESDPIDIQSNVGAYNKLSHIVPFQNILFVLSSGSVQFEVRGSGGEGGVSPFNVEFRPTSFFSTSKLTAPQKMGNNVFFINSGKVYLYLSGSSFNDEYSTSMDISAHCKDYLPQDLGAITVSSGTNTILMTDKVNKNRIYLFAFKTNGEKIIQQAFHRWVYHTSDKIMALKSYEKDLYLIAKRPVYNSTTEKLTVYFQSLESVSLTTPMMDCLFKTGAGFLGAGLVSIPLPFYDPTITTCITAEEWGNGAYVNIPCTNTTDAGTGLTIITIAQPPVFNPVYLGRPYEMSVELSRQVFRTSPQAGATVIEGVLNLKRITTNHLKSGSYDIDIIRNGRTATSTTFFPTNINSLLSLPQDLKIETTGEHLVKVLAYSEAARIFIKSSYPTPCNISDIEILGTFRAKNTSIE